MNDLTQFPPRSPRVRLRGYVIVPRLLDKGRAALAGKLGEYHYNCPLDQRFFNFVGINPDRLKEQLAAGLGDREIVTWIEANAAHKHAPWEVEQWSHWQEKRAPSDTESREFFNRLHKEAGNDRGDIVTWFELLDLDDYISFGGKA